ncbi:3-oxoadipate enol-lactonase 2 [compost metagenome]
MFKDGVLSYYMMGSRNKETIVLLHAAFADHQLFEQQIAFFQEHYQLILLDLPGHGENQTRGSKVTLADMPDIISLILADNRIASCHVLGVSLGSLVAQAFAARYPDQINSVIIVGGYSIHKANEQVLKAQRREGLKWMFSIMLSLKSFKRRIARNTCSTEQGRRLMARSMERFRRSSFLAMNGMNAFFVSNPSPVPYPLMIVVGEHDLPVILESSRQWHELEKGSHYTLLPGAGHCANADTPDAFNRAVAHFLAP